MLKTIGIFVVAALAASAAVPLRGVAMMATPSTDQIGHQFRQPIVFILRKAVFDRYVAALDVARLAQTFTECRYDLRAGFGGTIVESCCALAASGHAPAAPPRRVMNSRRRMGWPGSGRDVRFMARPPGTATSGPPNFFIVPVQRGKFITLDNAELLDEAEARAQAGLPLLRDPQTIDAVANVESEPIDVNVAVMHPYKKDDDNGGPAAA